jgi:DHA1 family inner membrane transport protein
MDRTINIVCFLIFSSALSVRAIDPVVPQIAADLAIAPTTAAMLAAGFAAYGLVQPVLGPLADSFGKARAMIACLLLLTIASFLSAVVTGFWPLFILRVLTGAACGGSFPIGMALVSDFVPLAQRQVMIGRLLTATISGNLLGAAVSGVVADVLHWRGMFVALGFVSFAAMLLGIFGLRTLPSGPRHPIDIRTVLERNKAIFRIRAARICYSTVAIEALLLFGIFPYVAVLLTKGGEPRASIAGLVVAAFALGGMVYSLSVKRLLRWLGPKQIMSAGGVLAAVGLFIVAGGPPWPVQAAAFATMGLGFYMLHASIQVYVTEFAPETRSSAVAFHTFSFFIGGGISPVLYGIGLDRIEAEREGALPDQRLRVNRAHDTAPRPEAESRRHPAGRRSARTRRSGCRRADTNSRRCAATPVRATRSTCQRSPRCMPRGRPRGS